MTIATMMERELDALELELETTDDPVERRAIMRAMRDLEREEGEREHWQNEGLERGWL